jgi:hypothetical protein
MHCPSEALITYLYLVHLVHFIAGQCSTRHAGNLHTAVASQSHDLTIVSRDSRPDLSSGQITYSMLVLTRSHTIACAQTQHLAQSSDLEWRGQHSKVAELARVALVVDVRDEFVDADDLVLLGHVNERDGLGLDHAVLDLGPPCRFAARVEAVPLDVEHGGDPRHGPDARDAQVLAVVPGSSIKEELCTHSWIVLRPLGFLSNLCMQSNRKQWSRHESADRGSE